MREQLQADVHKSKGRQVDQPAAYTVDIWFQSTPTWGDAGGKPSAFSCIRAMKNGIDLAIDQGISIHPPREGWDTTGRRRVSVDARFQSTHPARGGTSEAGKQIEQ